MHTSHQAFREVGRRSCNYEKRLNLLGDLAFQSRNLGCLISLHFALILLGAGLHPP